MDVFAITESKLGEKVDFVELADSVEGHPV